MLVVGVGWDVWCEGGGFEGVWKGEMKFCSCLSIGDGKFGVH